MNVVSWKKSGSNTKLETLLKCFSLSTDDDSSEEEPPTDDDSEEEDVVLLK